MHVRARCRYASPATRAVAVTVLWVLALLVPAGAATARRTEVLLKSNPAGATVAELGLGYLGTTNTTASFERGSLVTFVFTLEGYREQRVTRKLKGRWMEVGVDLEPLPGTPLRVDLEPSHARFKLLSLDGEVLLEGKGGDVYRLDDVPWSSRGAPDFVVEVAAPGYRTLRSRVTLRRHQSRTLAFVLAGQETLLEVSSDPLGAAVEEQSLGHLGATPLRMRLELEELIRRGLVLEPETDARVALVLTVSKRGHEPVVREVALDFSRPSTAVRVVLETAGGGSRP